MRSKPEGRDAGVCRRRGRAAAEPQDGGGEPSSPAAAALHVSRCRCCRCLTHLAMETRDGGQIPTAETAMSKLRWLAVRQLSQNSLLIKELIPAGTSPDPSNCR